MEEEHKENIYKSTFYTTMGTFFSLTGHLVSISILTRFLSKNDYGFYIIILVIVGLFEIFAGLGIENGLVRFVAISRQRANKFLFASLFIRSFSFVGTALLFLLLINIAPILLGINIKDFIVYILILSFITLQRDTLLKIIQGLLDFKILSLNQILTSITRLLIILLFILNSTLNISLLLIIEIIVPFVSSLFLYYNLVTKHDIKFTGVEKTDIKSILFFSLPLYFNNFFNFLYGRINVMILATKLGPISAGLYDVSGKIPAAFSKLFDSFVTVFYPRQAKSFSNADNSRVLEMLERSIIIYSWLVIIIFLIFFIIGEHVIVVLFSNKYIATAPALLVLILSFYFRISSNLKGYTIVACGKSKIPMIVNLISTLIGLIVVFSLVEQFDFLGAIFGVLIMNIIADVLYTGVLRNLKIFSIKIFISSLFGYILVGVVLAKIFFMLFYPPLIIIIFIGIIYTLIFKENLFIEINNLIGLLTKTLIYSRIKNKIHMK